MVTCTHTDTYTKIKIYKLFFKQTIALVFWWFCEDLGYSLWHWPPPQNDGRMTSGGVYLAQQCSKQNEEVSHRPCLEVLPSRWLHCHRVILPLRTWNSHQWNWLKLSSTDLCRTGVWFSARVLAIWAPSPTPQTKIIHLSSLRWDELSAESQAVLPKQNWNWS